MDYHRHRMLKIVLIATMGGVGSVLRYLLANALQRPTTEGAFPVGTFCVNVLGCFCAGLLAAVFAERLPIREELRVAVMVGFLGGFTTFSSFGVETVGHWMTGHRSVAIAYVAASITVGLFAVWAGFKVGGR